MADEEIQPVHTETAEHYTWGQNCDGWHLVKNGSLSVIEEVMPPGSSEVRHRHRNAQQFFYILDGEATMEVEGKEMILPAGSGIEIRPSVRHQMKNESGKPVHFLVISQPPSHGDRVTE